VKALTLSSPWLRRCRAAKSPSAIYDNCAPVEGALAAVFVPAKKRSVEKTG